MKRLNKDFFTQEAIDIAPLLLGKTIVVNSNNSLKKYRITELEVYYGEEDTACHASKGKTERTKVMYQEGGVIYVYLIYGMYWMLNFVTGKKNHPQAILIRSVEGISGPGRVGKELQLDKSFYGEDLCLSDRIWIEDNNQIFKHSTSKRIGINYASKEWRDKKWRYYIKEH